MRIGDQVGSYRLVRLVAEGGMGAVYEASNDQLERRVAIKLMHACWAHDPEQRRRFFNEARCVNLISHPGLVTIHEYGQLADGNAYTVMEYLEGRTLAQHQQDRPGAPLPVAMTLRIARQVAAALCAVHEKGVVHRDLKPDNLMLIPDPEVPGGLRVKILDFGIAKQKLPTGTPPRGGTRPGFGLGTPAYMAPEQIYGASSVDGRADVYSLGMILYELLSGRPPFPAADSEQQLRCHLTLEPPPLSRRCPAAPAALRGLVHSMLAKQPHDRPVMSEVLSRLTAMDVATAELLATGPRPGPRVSLRSLAGGALAMLFLLGTLSIGWTDSGHEVRRVPSEPPQPPGLTPDAGRTALDLLPEPHERPQPMGLLQDVTPIDAAPGFAPAPASEKPAAKTRLTTPAPSKRGNRSRHDLEAPAYGLPHERPRVPVKVLRPLNPHEPRPF